MADCENEIQDLGRELHDMLKDIDSMSLHSSSALVALDASGSMLVSQDAARYEASIDCIKVTLIFPHLLLMCAHNYSFDERLHRPVFLGVQCSCMHAFETAVSSRMISKEMPLRSKCISKPWPISF